MQYSIQQCSNWRGTEARPPTHDKDIQYYYTWYWASHVMSTASILENIDCDKSTALYITLTSELWDTAYKYSQVLL